jgi:hypothetical protein
VLRGLGTKRDGRAGVAAQPRLAHAIALRRARLGGKRLDALGERRQDDDVVSRLADAF